MSEYHFAMARISAAHICRAMGFERGSGTVLDAFADIMIQYMTMLAKSALAMTEARGGLLVEVEDILLAALECGAVKPLSVTNRQLGYSEDVDELLQWMKSSIKKRMEDVVQSQRSQSSKQNVPVSNLNMQPSLISSTSAMQPAPPPEIPSSHLELQSHSAHQSLSDIQSIFTSQPGLEFSQNNEHSQPPGLHSENFASSSASAQNAAQQIKLDSLPLDWLEVIIFRQALMGHRDWTTRPVNVEPDPTIHGA